MLFSLLQRKVGFGLTRLGFCVPSTCSKSDLSTLLFLYFISGLGAGPQPEEIVNLVIPIGCVDQVTPWQPDGYDIMMM